MRSESVANRIPDMGDGTVQSPSRSTMKSPCWCTALLSPLEHRGPGASQLFHRPFDPVCKALLRKRKIRARVVGLLVADLPVNFEDAVEVPEHMPSYRPGEGVLRIGVDVHLDDAVVD